MELVAERVLDVPFGGLYSLAVLNLFFIFHGCNFTKIFFQTWNESEGSCRKSVAEFFQDFETINMTMKWVLKTKRDYKSSPFLS